jgi:hypothetical protein
MKTHIKINLIIVNMVLFTCLSVATSFAQDTSKVTYKATAELVSSYIFRGVLATPSPSPNIQPTIAVDIKKIEIGVWGSTDFVGMYKEADLYGTYTAGPLAINITDYFFSNQPPNYMSLTNPTPPGYFEYSSNKTGHIVEGSLAYSGPAKFPISILIATMFFGNDKKYNFSTNSFETNNNYSTYVEVGYQCKDVVKVFVGATPWNGYYGAQYGKIQGFGIVNAGATITRNIKISDKFDLPVRASLITNPQAESIHLVFGITF